MTAEEETRLRERVAEAERDLDAEREARMRAVGEGNRMRRERDEAAIAAEHNAGRVIAEQDRRHDAERKLAELRALVRRVFARARWCSFTPDQEYEPSEELARRAADAALGDYLAGMDTNGHIDADAYEVAAAVVLTVWRVVDAESGTRLERDRKMAALLEVARG